MTTNIDVHDIVLAESKCRALGLSDHGRDMGYVIEVTVRSDACERTRLTLFCPNRDAAARVVAAMASTIVPPSKPLTPAEQAAEAEVRS